MSSTLRGPIKKDRPAPESRSVTRKSLSGAELGTVALEPTIFGIEPNMAVMHQVVKAQLAAKRSGTQSHQDPQGSARWWKEAVQPEGGPVEPVREPFVRRTYPGGGIALGPKPRKYDQKTPKKMIRLALYSALSDRASLERVALLDSFEGWTVPKTKEAISALSALGLEGKILVVLSRDDSVAISSFRNLNNVKTIDAGEVNAYDVLDSDWILFTDATLPVVKEIV
jgi:large subunit ribosomal protein L4